MRRNISTKVQFVKSSGHFAIYVLHMCHFTGVNLADSMTLLQMKLSLNQELSSIKSQQYSSVKL